MIKFLSSLVTIFCVSFFTISNVYSSNRVTPVSEAVKLIQNSVVNIRTEKIVSQFSSFNDPFFDDFFGFNNTYKTQSIGSGVIVSKNGIIVTNAHVIEAASKIYIILSDNRQLEAEVVGSDSVIDIAVIKVKQPASDLVPAILGTSSDIMLGETVIAIGNPYGLTSSVTTGVVSNVKRVVGDKNGFSIFVQVDASINPGNSGGPLINLDGEVIGINTAIFKEVQGIGFSIPIDTVKRAVPEFIKYGKIRRGYPGFSVLERKSSNQVYLEIVGVKKGSNAERMGIKQGDRLATIDHLPINTKEAFNYIIRTYPVGDKLSIQFSRVGVVDGANLVMEDFPLNYGLDNLKERYGIIFAKTSKAIVVTESNMERYIRIGDQIIGINDIEVTSENDLTAKLNDNIGEVIILNMMRQGRVFSVRIQT